MQSFIRILVKIKKGFNRFLSSPKKISGHFLYYMFITILKLFSKSKHSLPTLGEKNCIIKKIEISDKVISRMMSDLTKQNNINLVKKSYKYFVQKYNMDYLKDVNHAWGFDRSFYTKFFDENFGEAVKKIYSNYNYRIENIWLYKTLNHNNSKTENINSKLHTDNDPAGALKIIVYLCEVDKSNGPFEYLDEKSNEKISVYGNVGTTIFFNPNKLKHSGSATLNKERVALSFLIFPTLRKKINYVEKKPANAIFTYNPLTKSS